MCVQTHRFQSTGRFLNKLGHLTESILKMPRSTYRSDCAFKGLGVFFHLATDDGDDFGDRLGNLFSVNT